MTQGVTSGMQKTYKKTYTQILAKERNEYDLQRACQVDGKERMNKKVHIINATCETCYNLVLLIQLYNTYCENHWQEGDTGYHPNDALNRSTNKE
jgi:hypothetical protein